MQIITIFDKKRQSEKLNFQDGKQRGIFSGKYENYFSFGVAG